VADGTWVSSFRMSIGVLKFRFAGHQERKRVGCRLRQNGGLPARKASGGGPPSDGRRMFGIQGIRPHSTVRPVQLCAVSANPESNLFHFPIINMRWLKSRGSSTFSKAKRYTLQPRNTF
jgi:hypothetical protein